LNFSGERDLERRYKDPIETWDEIKEKLKEKYLSPSHKDPHKPTE